MRTQHLQTRLGTVILFVTLAWLSAATPSGESGRTLHFPAPPDPGAIGTRIGDINTYVSRVTIPPPTHVERFGLHYLEVRGTIAGVGWGGMPVTLRCHYSYELPYVLRIPPAWDGGLVVFRHGSAPLALWEQLEADLGAASLGRVFHEQADRFLSDVALHPSRRWAYFAVNQIGVAPGGAHNTRLVGGEPGCPEGMPTQSILDVSIGRDHALLAQHLLHTLRGRRPTLTLGTGHSAGPVPNFLLNAGVDHRRPLGGPPVQAGDNNRIPYAPASGRIFDGFLAIQSGFMNPLQAALLNDVSVPTIFLAAEADRGFTGAVSQIHQMVASDDVDAQSLSRLYTVRNLAHVDSDLVLSLKSERTNFTDPAIPDNYRGGGERLKPLTSALLDALANWVTWGTPPPVSLFNGEVKTMPDRIEFHRTSPPATSFPYVDDENLDTYLQPPPVVPPPPLRTAWSDVRAALGGVIGSIVLPETACRRGGLHFVGVGPIGTRFEPFDEWTFLNRWGSSAVHQSCRVLTVDALAAAGFYDPTVVTVDVDPGQFPNVVSRSPGRVEVAIFSTIGFDATTIVPGSLRMASTTAQGRAAPPGDARMRIVDVNHDGRPDALVEFRRERLHLDPEVIVVDVWGRTRGGVPFAGTDVVQIVP